MVVSQNVSFLNPKQRQVILSSWGGGWRFVGTADLQLTVTLLIASRHFARSYVAPAGCPPQPWPTPRPTQRLPSPSLPRPPATMTARLHHSSAAEPGGWGNLRPKPSALLCLGVSQVRGSQQPGSGGSSQHLFRDCTVDPPEVC